MGFRDSDHWINRIFLSPKNFPVEPKFFRWPKIFSLAGDIFSQEPKIFSDEKIFTNRRGIFQMTDVVYKGIPLSRSASEIARRHPKKKRNLKITLRFLTIRYRFLSI